MTTKKRKSRKSKRAKVIWQSPFSRAVTSYESLTAAKAAAKQMREGLRGLGRAGRGCAVWIEKEED